VGWSKIDQNVCPDVRRDGEEHGMPNLTRRSVIRGSLGLAAAEAVTRPYIANAAVTTATVWWVQGFAQEEDVSFKKIVAEYEKASGNAIDYSIMPYAPMRQKIVSAVTSGVVPDLFQNTPAEIIALHAWEDRLVDATDVIETQKSQYGPDTSQSPWQIA
jgi:ABC-type glycerol-3-phosphate transport system substrate-binding protein